GDGEVAGKSVRHGAADTEAIASVAAENPVLGEETVGDNESGPLAIGDATATTPAGRRADADGLVVGQDHAVEGQGAAGIQDAAPIADRPTVRDRQVVDGDRLTRNDVKHPALVVAADGQQVGPRAIDRQVVGDTQLAAGQADRADEP